MTPSFFLLFAEAGNLAAADTVSGAIKGSWQDSSA